MIGRFESGWRTTSRRSLVLSLPLLDGCALAGAGASAGPPKLDARRRRPPTPGGSERVPARAYTRPELFGPSSWQVSPSGIAWSLIRQFLRDTLRPAGAEARAASPANFSALERSSSRRVAAVVAPQTIWEAIIKPLRAQGAAWLFENAYAGNPAEDSWPPDQAPLEGAQTRARWRTRGGV